MKRYFFRLLALALPLAAFLILAVPAFAQTVTFQPEGPYKDTGGQPTDIVRGDFDRDGDLDLAAVSSGTVTIFQNDGSGNYSTAPTPLPSGAFANPTSIDRGDFNGDGKPDIVVTDGVSNVYVYLNTNATPGVISFGTPPSHRTVLAKSSEVSGQTV